MSEKKKKPTIGSLTIKKEKFAQLVVTLGNASAAYRLSYDAKKMKPETVTNEASKLLKDPNVTARVKLLREEHAKKHVMTRERVMLEYARIATQDITDIFDEYGQLKPIGEMDEDTRRAIAGIEFQSLKLGKKNIGRLAKIKMVDKKGALDSLAKMNGWIVERKEITGKGGGPIETENKVSAADLTPEELKKELEKRNLPLTVLDK